LSLDGRWEFTFNGRDIALAGGSRIRAPGIWQTQFPQLRNAPGVGRYRRRVSAPDEWRGRAVFLVMEGVFHESTILIDERPVARHGDGWTTLDIDLTEALVGKGEFTLGVDAVVPDERGLGDASLGETLVAKQDWYGLQGGIWKPAWLEARSLLHIAQLEVQTRCVAAGGAVRARGRLSRREPGAMLRLSLSRDGVEVARSEAVLDGDAFDWEMSCDDIAPWSPDRPALYACDAALFVGETCLDSMTRTVGFRRFEARGGRLWLNGEPFQMFGALDQDWHPQEECRPPSAELLEQRFRNAKAIGINTLRCHVKIPDKLYFDLADSLGLIVWLDMPYCEYLTPRARESLSRVFFQSVVEHAHHPSICIWTLFNEGWGIDLDDNPGDRLWLKGLFDEAKSAVPGSLVVDNSACFPRNYHVKTDIEDFHWYNGFPHQTAEFRSTTEAFARRASFPWSPHGDAVRRGDEPLVCSEFGVWGLPRLRDILEDDGTEPWWFESGHDWNGGAAYPHGVETRFRDAGLAAVFGDLDGFVDAAQEFQFRGLKAQIEALRWEPAISGYVITELNDTQWEANGLMDARNHPRRFSSRLAALQTPWLALARTPRTAVACGERFEVELRLAGPQAPPPGSRVAWRCLDQSGAIQVGEQPAKVELVAPESSSVGLADFQLEAFSNDGRTLSRNSIELCFVSQPIDGPPLCPLDAEAAGILAALRWRNVVQDPGRSPVLFATRLTAPVREHLLSGRNVVLVANSEQALTDPGRHPISDRHNFPRMAIRKREGTSWDGRWMGGFAWRRTDERWALLPGGPMLDEHWLGLTPDYVLTSFFSTAYSGLVDAGIVVAWLHASAAFVKRTRLGPGQLTVTTFDFGGGTANPLAPHLLAAIVAG
jgi:hypothetical protein